MKINRQGYTRIVIIIGNLVFKIPNFMYSQRCFLWGLLGNHNETTLSKNKSIADRICPVLFSLPLGLLVIMPKVQVLNDLQYQLYYREIQELVYADGNSTIYAEDKSDSYGIYKGRVVIIDYGY